MNALYFKINLNKYGELKQKQEAEKKTFLNTVVTFFVLLAILVGFSLWVNSTLDRKYKNRVTYIKSIKKEIERYKDNGEYLSQKDLERLTTISTERIFWSKKLVALADKTNDKIAITHFSYKNDTFSLFGITKLDREVNEHSLIEEFIGSLKENKQISSDFSDIKFVSSRHDIEKDTEILRFQIDLFSKDKKDGKK
jgi:hypothetical protein